MGAAVHFTDDDLRQMLAGELCSRTASAKDLARRVDCDVRAAEHYRAGRHLPPLPVFLRMVGALGSDLWECVNSPATAHARLTAEIARHEEAAAQLRRQREMVERGEAGVASVSSAHR